MNKLLMAAGVVASLMGTMAHAKTYVCNIKPDGRDTGWISKTVAINIDDVTNKVLVSDAVILYFNKKPIEGKLSLYSSKRVTVTWEVRGAKDRRNRNVARFMYRATIYRATNKMIISARPTGYENTFGGSGRCGVK